MRSGVRSPYRLGLMISGGVMVAQRFLVPLVGVRIYTGKCLGSSMAEHHTCNMVVGGSIPLLSLKEKSRNVLARLDFSSIIDV